MPKRECSNCKQNKDEDEDFHQYLVQEVRGAFRQSWCKECKARYNNAGRAPAHETDGAKYTAVGRSEWSEGFEARDRLRRAALIKRAN